ncbi:heterokaryon incompatibility protein-domain-containing protein [Paraphoma chrysanthemicola]|uniref:Heterokaryon incompatibility protein-domain-containing protein n=1 Tax=Paraphoma chrysanthemicola TaxID=798071 RepID=A0A8K0R229_9PLEO|nr:heterokaryon incompatibility protein-domain-containing protein [Paraphoma chrysanthemicola]
MDLRVSGFIRGRRAPPPLRDNHAEACPEGFVSLHELCDACTELVGIVEKPEKACRWSKSKNTNWSINDSAGELIARSTSCHLCTIILTCFKTNLATFPGVTDQSDWEKDGRIYFSIEDRSTFVPDAENDDIAGIRFTKNEHGKGFLTIVPFEYGHFDKFEGMGYLGLGQAPKTPAYDATQLRGWLHACTSTHLNCHTFQHRAISTNIQPSKLLEIDEDLVKLRSNDPDQHAGRARYVTLSHMWGDDIAQQFVLVQSRMSEFERGIPCSVLPPIFQEAVFLTRLLGFRYIWIDSLCIVQDSESDWQQEAPKMASIYGGASCNLACVVPPSRFHRNSRLDPRSALPCILRRASPQKAGLYAIGEYRDRRLLENGIYASDWHDPAQWPLSSRAWTFQEQILAPRTVYFGHQNLLWECAEAQIDEWLGRTEQRFMPGVPSKTEMYSTLYHDDPRQAQSDLESPTLVLWNSLIKEYRLRALTKPEDRVMAIAGIARAIHDVTGLTYLAGLWLEHVPLCLVWCMRPGSSKPAKTMSEPALSNAPTWSWLSIGVDSRCSLRPDLAMRWFDELNEERSTATIFEATVTSFKWPNDPPNHSPGTSFHIFGGLQITLNMHVLPIDTVVRKSSYIKNHLTIDIHEPHCMNHFVYLPDVPAEGDELPPGAMLGLLREARQRPRIGASWYQTTIYDLVGLVLVTAPKAGTWRRTGVWVMRIELMELSDRPDPTVFNILRGARGVKRMTLVWWLRMLLSLRRLPFSRIVSDLQMRSERRCLERTRLVSLILLRVHNRSIWKLGFRSYDIRSML